MRKLLLLIPILLFTACGPQGNSTQRSEAEIGDIVKDYLMKNPQVILESVEQYQKDQFAEEQKKSADQLASLLPEIISSGPFIGKADAENVVVEFFDYNCGYCKRAFANIVKLHQEDANIKIIFKELPILSPNSELLSRAALAVHNKQPEKYFEFHAALMANKGQATQEVIEGIAENIGITGINFAEEIKSDAVSKEIEKNRDLSAKIGIQGTPAFIVNGELVRGAVPVEELKAKFK